MSPVGIYYLRRYRARAEDKVIELLFYLTDGKIGVCQPRERAEQHADAVQAGFLEVHADQRPHESDAQKDRRRYHGFVVHIEIEDEDDEAVHDEDQQIRHGE